MIFLRALNFFFICYNLRYVFLSFEFIKDIHSILFHSICLSLGKESPYLTFSLNSSHLRRTPPQQQQQQQQQQRRRALFACP